MGNIISQKPSEPAGVDQADFAIRGWIAGWTLTAPPEILFHVTAIPLGLVCAQLPGHYELEIPGVKEPWTLPISPDAECRLSPHGIRLIEEHDDHDSIASIVQHDTSTLLIEADEELLIRSLNPEAVITEAEATVTVSAGKHAVVFFLQRNTEPARLVITAGTGDVTRLIAKARSMITISAHAQLDLLLARQTTPQTGSTFSISPTDYLRSRFRPATPSLPYPWLTDEEDEPVWRMERACPAFRALLLTSPDLAAGMIGNLLECMDGDGHVPLAGGNASPIFNGPAHYPLLITMIMEYHQQIGEWPFELSTHVRRLETYIRAICETDPSENEYHPTAVQHELSQWSEFIRLSGITVSNSSHPTLNEEQKTSNQAALFAELLDRRISRAKRRTMASTLLGQISQNPQLLFSEENLAHIPDLLKELSAIDRPAVSVWMSTLRPLLAASWRQAINALTSPAHSRNADIMVLVGVCSWLEHWKSRDPEQMYHMAGWFNRHRIATMVGCGIFILLIIGFLLSVQFRSTMPLTVYETQMGMALQDYQTDDYEAAIAKLEDIALRGHQENPLNLFLLGKVHFRNKNYAEAITAFQRVVDVSPTYPAGYFNLGLSLFHHGDIEASVEVFTEMSTLFATTHPMSAARALRAAEIITRYEKTGN